MKIDPEFQSLIPPLAKEELAQLEANILAEGCRDPLVVWRTRPDDEDAEDPDDSGNPMTLEEMSNHIARIFGETEVLWHDDKFAYCVSENPYAENLYDRSAEGWYRIADATRLDDTEDVLIDGHNRYAICTKHGLQYHTKPMFFASRESVMDWMDANQLGRRNLTPDQFTLLLGRRYNRAKKAAHAGENQYTKKNAEGKICPQQTTADVLAAEHGVSPRTVKNAGQYAAAVETIKAKAPEAVISMPRKDVVKAAELLETKPEKAMEILIARKPAKEIEREEKKAEREAMIAAQREAIETGAVSLPDGVYEVVAMDPPWNYGREYDPDSSRVANPYPEMTQDQLLALEPPFADDCVLFLWTTHAFMRDAHALLDKWGFTYKATIVWDKEKIGMGTWVRMQCEFCLVAVRGKPTWNNTTWRDIIREPRREHSRKPEKFYEFVESVTVGRRLDFFSREQRNGWASYGNDTKKF